MKSLSQAAGAMDGTLHGADRSFDGVSTDTRSLQESELFVALKGPNFDGRDYIERAAEIGAAGAVVNGLVESDLPQLVVEDTRLALGQLGAAWRNSKDIQVVGITGSNGKTTLKELVAACLATAAPTLATHGNLNNDIGVPVMLNRMSDEHQFAVIEMGANHAGEIAYLAGLASPDVVVVTNAGAAHLEGFGSIEGVAHAKGEIYQTTRRPRVAVLNADDSYFAYWSSLVTDIEALSFGFADTADVRATDLETRPDGSRFTLLLNGEAMTVSLPLPGTHNVQNAMAAAAVASALDIPGDAIVAALQGVKPVAGRIQPLPGINGCTLYDDSYNANPYSVRAAADFLAALDGESWLILGDMKELGEDAMELHREVGASARTSGVDRLFALGDLTQHAVDGFGRGAKWYDSLEALLTDAVQVGSKTNLLVKGSRSMQMERVVDALRRPDSMRREA